MQQQLPKSFSEHLPDFGELRSVFDELKRKIGFNQHREAPGRAGFFPGSPFMLISFMGVTAFVVDIGRGIIAYHMIQASCDAAAMAGVQLMGSDLTQTATNVQAQARLFSSVSGNYNANPTLLPGATITKNSVYCSAVGTAAGIPCVGAANTANAITVAQKVTLPTIFAGIVGIPNLTVGATSSALMAGAAAQKYNIAVVIDTTQSMTQSDPGGCPGNQSKIQCAMSGVRTLLAGLQPCTSGTGGSSGPGCSGFDSVAIFTYPEVPANKASQDTTCNGSAPTPVPYLAPLASTSFTPPTISSTTFTSPNFGSSTGTYQITNNTTNPANPNPFASDWSSNGQAIGTTGSYSSTSGIANAAGRPGCSGMNAKGGEGTYFAGAIYAAGAALAYQGANVANSKNALIILSDGDASSSKSQFDPSVKLSTTGVYPSAIDECHQAITAANYVSNNVPNTTVFTIAYNASNIAYNGSDQTGNLLDRYDGRRSYLCLRYDAANGHQHRRRVRRQFLKLHRGGAFVPPGNLWFNQDQTDQPAPSGPWHLEDRHNLKHGSKR